MRFIIFVTGICVLLWIGFISVEGVGNLSRFGEGVARTVMGFPDKVQQFADTRRQEAGQAAEESATGGAEEAAKPLPGAVAQGEEPAAQAGEAEVEDVAAAPAPEAEEPRAVAPPAPEPVPVPALELPLEEVEVAAAAPAPEPAQVIAVAPEPAQADAAPVLTRREEAEVSRRIVDAGGRTMQALGLIENMLNE